MEIIWTRGRFVDMNFYIDISQLFRREQLLYVHFFIPLANVRASFRVSQDLALLGINFFGVYEWTSFL
jgi:hypothetical protein